MQNRRLNIYKIQINLYSRLRMKNLLRKISNQLNAKANLKQLIETFFSLLKSLVLLNLIRKILTDSILPSVRFFLLHFLSHIHYRETPRLLILMITVVVTLHLLVDKTLVWAGFYCFKTIRISCFQFVSVPNSISLMCVECIGPV